MKQVFNPYLPGWEYIPDAEPHVFEGRLYIFGSHDKAGGDDYCLNDYVCWSAPEDDLSDWRYEGVIYKRTDHPTEPNILFAPDVVQGLDGKYYLYYSVANSCIISVAVCDTPAGRYRYYGDVHDASGHIYGSSKEDYFSFDPAVLVDVDGRIWLYSGSGQDYNRKFGHPLAGCFVMELETDMITIKSPPKILLKADESLERPNFFEGSSIRHIGELYYLIYPATDLTGLNYATSRFPDRDFVHRGCIHSSSEIGYQGRRIADARYPIGNNHGGLVCVKGQWYIFDHRMTNRSFFSRQGVAEPVVIKDDGSIDMVPCTSCGLNGGPLRGIGKYPAYIACVLFGSRIVSLENPFAGPYITQDSPDFDPEAVADEEPIPYVRELRENDTVGFRYFDFSETQGISLELRGFGSGVLIISQENEGEEIGMISVSIDTDKWIEQTAFCHFSKGISGLYIRYRGEGSIDLLSFTLF